MDNLLSLIGLAKRAGRLEVGEDPVASAVYAHKARLLLVASDAAENTFRRTSNFAEGAKFACLQLPFTKAELGNALGRASCAVLAVCDVGFASSITRKLAAQNPETYGEVALTLDKKAAKARLRQKEQAAHEKSLAQQKRNPWNPPLAASGGKKPTPPRKKKTKQTPTEVS